MHHYVAARFDEPVCLPDDRIGIVVRTGVVPCIDDLAPAVFEVAYALPEKQYLQRVTLQQGATVEEAIRASGLLELRTDIDLSKNKVGIYSRPVKLADVLHDGDRVEIYRPLIADPKELRRQRAEKSAKK